MTTSTLDRIVGLDQPAPRRSGAEVDPLHPHHLVAHEGYTYLHSRLNGSVGDDPEEGLFDFDTRILSRHVLRVGGREPLGSGWVSATGECWRAILHVDLPGGDATGPGLPQDVIEVRIERWVGRGMDERLTLVNRSMRDVATDLSLELAADFRDVLELFADDDIGGRVTADHDPGGRRLQFLYRATHEGRSVERGLRVTLGGGWDAVARIELSKPPASAGATTGSCRVRLPLHLGPREAHVLGIVYESLVDGEWRAPAADRVERRAAARAGRPVVEAPGDLVGPMYESAADDLLGLRNWDLETAEDEWLVNAGVPVFTGFFGRDSLTAGFQAALLGPEFMRGAVAQAAATQGRRDDAFTEEQPGRMIHEMRRGPLSDLGIRPHRAYYGSATTGSMFILTLSELWHWTGERAVLERYREAAERVIEWAERDGDRDGDGLVEYVQRSPQGLKNLGWKDSDEAIRYPDGTIVDNPIATIDEQAFYYIALQRMAEIQLALEDDEAADRCLGHARRLREAVDDRFWMPDQGFYALAIDAHGEQVRTIASNPIHALGAGLVRRDRARMVVARLLQPDLFSGWGVRTLSAGHPSYNPFAYHLGAVWPVENATFAVGAKRYGIDDAVERIAAGLFAAAGHHHRLRLPEVFAGHGSSVSAVPVSYPRAKSPQAWSASASIQVLQTLLGIQPFAAAGILALVRPRLPPWLPEVTIRGLRVGRARVDLHFERGTDGSTSHDTLAIDGDLRVIEVPPPAEPASDRSVLERLATFVLEHAPGRTARTIRIALGIEDGLD